MKSPITRIEYLQEVPGFHSVGHIYKSLNIIFAKMSIILEGLNILSTNISRFTVMFNFYLGLPHLLLLLSNIVFFLVRRNHFYPSSEICNLHIVPEQKLCL